MPLLFTYIVIYYKNGRKTYFDAFFFIKGRAEAEGLPREGSTWCAASNTQSRTHGVRTPPNDRHYSSSSLRRNPSVGRTARQPTDGRPKR